MTIIATVRVYASAISANALLLTLVSVSALVGLGIPRLSRGTLASERAGSVEAFSTLAQSRNRIAFVDVCMRKRERLTRCFVQLFASLAQKIANHILSSRTAIRCSYYPGDCHYHD